jgi:hypothetical protein
MQPATPLEAVESQLTGRHRASRPARAPVIRDMGTGTTMIDSIIPQLRRRGDLS